MNKPHDFIFLTYVDDDGLPLHEEDGDVLWEDGRAAGDGIINYIRIDKLSSLVREIRQHVFNNHVSVSGCQAWQELEKIVAHDEQTVFVFHGEMK